MSAPATLRDLVLDAARRLADAGIEAARHDAKLMMLAAAGMDAAALIRREREVPDAETAGRFEAMVRERLSRRPLQHILGVTEFYGLELRTDARALIPRPDSETVVEAALGLLPPGRAAVVADLGAGSGCLLAAVLDQRPQVRGVGVEASADAASLARENLAALGLSGRVDVLEGSWADWTGWAHADLVMSNPPYIPTGEIPALAPEVRDHDPVSALDGGPDGLSAFREIIALAADRLKPGAWLVLEIGYDQKAAVSGLLRAAGFSEIGSARDLGGNDRAVWGRKQGS